MQLKKIIWGWPQIREKAESLKPLTKRVTSTLAPEETKHVWKNRRKFEESHQCPFPCPWGGKEGAAVGRQDLRSLPSPQAKQCQPLDDDRGYRGSWVLLLLLHRMTTDMQIDQFSVKCWTLQILTHVSLFT